MGGVRASTIKKGRGAITPETVNAAIMLALAVFGAGWALIGLGLIWSPVGVWVVHRLTRARAPFEPVELEEGIVASVMFFLPWLYLMSRVLGRPLPAFAVGFGYAWLSVLWITGGVLLPLLIGVALKQSLVDPYGEWTRPDVVYQALVAVPHPNYWVAVAYCILVAVANGVLWSRSFYGLIVRHFRTRQLNPAPETVLIPDGYLSPFMVAAASLFCTVALGGGLMFLLLLLMLTSPND